MSDRLDVLLINPPFDRLQKRHRDHFPMGLAYLAGALKSAGRRVAVYNGEAPRHASECEFQRPSDMLRHREDYLEAVGNPAHAVWQEARRVIEETRPRVVGVSAWTEKLDAARVVSRLAKDVDPAVPVVWGGPHATLCTDECAAVPGVDGVIKGEGERTIAELVAQLLAGSPTAWSVAGVYRRDPLAGRVAGADRALEPDLDSLPYPDWESGLSEADWPGRRSGTQQLMSSRGCPYPCEYCAVQALWGRKVRFHSVGRVVDEIERRLAASGNRRFAFWDDSFTLDRRRTEALCQTLIDRKLKIEWTCITRGDLVDAKLLRALKAAGCHNVFFGVESASPRILSLTRKGKSTADVDAAFKACRQVGMPYSAYYMVGFPDDTEADIALTLQHMRRSGATFVGLNVFTPYPGTGQYRRALELGVLKEPVDWSRLGRHSTHNHFVAAIPRERFRQIVEESFRVADRVNGSPLRRIGAVAVRTLRKAGACLRARP